jgi:hypothetical protein
MPGKDHAFSAMAALSLLILFNCATIIGYFQLLDNSNIEKYKIPLFLFAIFVLVINYSIFIHKKKFEKIKIKFAKATKKQQLIGSIGVIAYVFVTFFLLFLVLFYK